MKLKEIAKEIMKTNDVIKLLVPVSLTKNEQIPPRELIFRAFDMNVEDIKVVMVGQDPYPQKGVATGLAFAVHKGAEFQPSLSIILDELAKYYCDPTLEETDLDETLESWESQGVLLLNASLTCDEKKPEDLSLIMQKGTHSNYWRFMLMEELFVKLDNILNNVPFIFMGSKASYYAKYIKKNPVITTAHPVADIYSGKNMFRGSKIFNSIDEIVPNIKWVKKEYARI